MNRTRYIACLLSVAAVLVSCGKESAEPLASASGLVLSICDDAGVTVKATPAEIGKKAKRQFNIKVVKTASGNVIYDGPFVEKIAAFGGSYTVSASCGEDVALGRDCPYFHGEANAEITSADPNPVVNIPCKVANALISVVYLDKEGNESQERFDSFFTSYKVSGELDNMSVDLNRMAQSLYFRAGTMPSSLVFRGTLAGAGRNVEYDLTPYLPASSQAADHIILRLSLSVTPSGVILDVAKAEVEHASISETIPMEWYPAPKLSLSRSEIQRFEDEDAPEDCIYSFSTSLGLQDVEISASIDDERFAELNGTRLLSEMDEATIQAFADAGIVLPALGQTYADEKIDLNAFIGGIKTNAGAISRNSIGLRVKANDRWSSEAPQTISATVKLLRFSLPAQIEGDAWSKTLYINPIGDEQIVAGEGVDVEEVKANLVYQLSTDGGATWTDASTSAAGEKLMTGGLANGTSYMLRARYPGSTLKSNSAEQTTETPAEVPNGDFETMRQTYTEVQVNCGNKYTVRVIVSADYQNYAKFTVQEPVGWASVNDKTCRTSISVQYSWYINPSTYGTGIQWIQNRGFGGVRGVEKENPEPYKNLQAQNGSNAVVIRNVGWSHTGDAVAVTGGRMNTKYYNENVPTDIRRSSGKLFLGSYSYGMETGEHYDEGTDFSVRPTALKGYYKYVQDGDNSEYGTVTVTLLNGDTVIGSGSQNLTARGSYGEFNVPVTYSNTALKATSLRIMFTSSRHASYSQAEENSNVKTTTYNGEYESCMRGATLTVDNLTFTYDR